MNELQQDYLSENYSARLIWRALLVYSGSPVSRADLKNLTGLHDRANREIISVMVKDFGFPIIAEDKAPGGYRIATEEEREAAAAVLDAKANSLHARAKALRDHHPEPEPVMTQGALFGEMV